MRRPFPFLLIIGLTISLSLLAQSLFSSGPTGAYLTWPTMTTPTAFLYLPCVAKNWSSLTTPTPSPTSTPTATPTSTLTRAPETPTATATATPTPSPRINLNGTWLYTYSVSETIPSGASWTPVDIPSFVAWDANQPYIWFKRTFTLPPNFPSERVYLDFQGIKYASKVYLNGTMLGEHLDGFTPFELAIPAGALRSNNELLIQVSDWRSALAPEAAQGQVSDPRELVDALIHPIGSQHYQLGIWQDVALVAYPEVRIKDVFVQTSVRNSEIVLEITLENLTDSNQLVTLGNDVFDGDQIVLTFAPVDVSLGPAEIKTMRLEQSWTMPHLWSPDDPYLYRLRSHLADGDERFVRFGFREFWVMGNEFYLNGTRIHLRATAAHPFAFSKQDALYYLQQAKAGNNVIMRFHAQPWPSSWYEAADEVGMLIVWESAYWCYGSGYRVEDDRFWEHFREHLRDQILLQRNHPSIVIWSLENELLHTSSDHARLPASEAKLAELISFVKSLDSTRPTMFEGDGDPCGQADVINLHYPHEYPIWNLWPNEAWWLEFTTQTDSYPGEISGWPLEKPLYIGEFLWVPMNWIEGASIFFGDSIYRDLIGYHRRGKATAWNYQLEAYRALGVQGICPWNIWEEGDHELPNPLYQRLVQEKFAANGLYLREKSERFFGGDTIRRTAYLFNDLLQPSHLTVTWELRSDATILDSGLQEFDLNPAEITQFDTEVHAPLVQQESAAQISYRVQRAGAVVFSYEEPIRIYPHCALHAGTTLYLYDPAGTTWTILENEGLSYQPVSDLSAIPEEAEVMIIGRDGLTAGETWRHIRNFAARGGRVLVLRQDRYPDEMPVPLTNDETTIVFPRRSSHPILVGMMEDELRFWAPNNLVIDKALNKPDSGLYLVLLDAGSALGLTQIGLMELNVESGTILLSQLDLLPKLDQEPAARKLFQSMLDYLAGYQPRTERQLRLMAITPEEEQGFRIIGFDLEALQQGSDSGSELIFTHGDLDRDWLSELLTHVEQGSILWLHKPSDALLAELGRLGLEVTAQAALLGQAFVTYVPQAEGLTSYSLFWAEGQARWAWELPPLNHRFAEMIFSAPADFSNATEIPPAQFTVVAELFDARSDQIVLYTNGYLETEIDVPEAGTYNIGLLAQGTPAAGEYPMVRVQLDGEAMGTVVVGAEQQIYYLTAELPTGRHCLRLEFFNDYWAPPEDRNLYFFNLLLAQVTDEHNLVILTQPPALVEIQYGSGFVLLDGLNWEKPGAQMRKQEFLVSLLANMGIKLAPPSAYWRLEAEEMEITAGSIVYPKESGMWFATNGTIAAQVNFTEGGRYLFKVLASGTPLAGVYPQFELAIDGQVVGSQSLQGQSASLYLIEAMVTPGVHQLSLSFINDDYAPPEDRNLFVDRITISYVSNLSNYE